MKIVAIVQARMGSTRLPGKVMLDVGGQPLISLLLQRLSRAQTISEIVVATTADPSDDQLAEHVSSLGYRVYRGSRTDVLERYLGAAQEAEADIVIRITGDCPLIDPDVVDNVVRTFLASGVDYASNVSPPSFPDGLDTEVFSFAALADSASRADTAFQREHVTPHLRESGLYSSVNFANDIDLSGQRWTVDEAADLDVVRSVVAHFAASTDFGFRDVAELAVARPELFLINHSIPRNQGATMGTGQKLWKRAKRVIPGGNMLLSKRVEMFLPDQWPAYFSKAKGCTVWDLDGNAYTDVSIMGIGTNTLGYGHPEVDAAVAKVVTDGNVSTFNAPEEVYLAEKLVEMHPWADMARFARSGGEANAIAIRIARAASGRDKVAFCGYHGWHDWYLAANLGDGTTLAGHLLPGLEPRGVPQDLQGSILPFNYNRFDELQKLADEHQLGVIFMEVARNSGPENEFLEKVRELATQKGIVLIFDECTSGFRQTFGGLHKLYGVDPDMATVGKALGNGYAITGVIGRREVMEAAQTTFISSTFWTERIGSAAALKTLEVMERLKSWELITATGLDIKGRWQDLADRHGLPITQWGLPALCGFTFQSENALAYKTLITQEMLKKGYLAGNSVYVCIDHTPEVLDNYFERIDSVFATIRKCEDGLDVGSLLEGPIAHSGFKRLN
ncbi:aminotransferase class III-fold pyridoxal phosphate-dependent enzyme [Devosia alba]|uniref:aminotransferase class III-fold pyridoxal phosphate-dependent enzyme n=1 Tax=Devosia alba TaxID=3152360 RepID=UPI0032652305